MISFVVEIDGIALTSVNLQQLTMLDVSIHSALSRDDFARVTVHGGDYRDGKNEHLTWVMPQPLRAGQSVGVRFIDTDGSFDRGQTFGDLFPGEAPPAYDPAKMRAEAAAMPASPQLRTSMTMTVATAAEPPCVVASDADNDTFSFHVMWGSERPDHARVSVRSYLSDDIAAGKRDHGQVHLSGKLTLGDSVTCTVNA
jgi:hypothetical protein